MPKNDEGEFELVLANRQLLSVIFIIMVLGGVLFSLGYFLGRHAASSEIASAGPVKAETEGSAAGSVGPSPFGAPKPVQTPAEPSAEEFPERTEPRATVSGTKPVQPPVEQASVPPAQAVRPGSASRSAAGQSVPQPEPNQIFLQVAAVRRPEAELIVDVLRKKGFNSRIAPGPDETLFRVLVGPLKDTPAIAKTRADLEAAGFRSAYIRKY